LEFRVYAVGCVNAPNRLKAELQTRGVSRCTPFEFGRFYHCWYSPSAGGDIKPLAEFAGLD